VGAIGDVRTPTAARTITVGVPIGVEVARGCCKTEHPAPDASAAVPISSPASLST
jgi:hypothetical protein